MIIYLIVCPLVFLAGFVDAIGGGGGLISLPAYILSGLPVHTAIATNKMSSSMGTTIATWQFWKNGYIKFPISLYCIIMALIGAPIGANLTLLINDEFLEKAMLVLLPIIAFYVLKTKNFNNEFEDLKSKKTIIISALSGFFIGIYDGIYGPGTGTFLILMLTGLAKMNLENAAGTTKAINLTSNYASLIVFLMNGKVNLILGFVAGIFSILGNFIGAKYFKNKGNKAVKPAIFLVLGIFFVKVLLENS